MSLFDTHKPVSGGNDFPEAQQYKFAVPGEALEGTILDISPDIDGDFGTYRILVIEDADEAQWKILAGSVLLDKVKRANAVVGGQLGVRFEGKRKTKTGNRSYNDWTVVYAAPEGVAPSGGVASSRPSRSSQAPF